MRVRKQKCIVAASSTRKIIPQKQAFVKTTQNGVKQFSETFVNRTFHVTAPRDGSNKRFDRHHKISRFKIYLLANFKLAGSGTTV
jgi:hypothetical protein